MGRYFEKISYNRFEKEVVNNQKLYESFNLPRRKTKNSAGYDFESVIDFVLKKGESRSIPTGIKCNMNKDEVLMIFIRSSLGIKHNIRLSNQVGIIDADYYNNIDNEGHIFIGIKNDGNADYTCKRGDRIAQGVFTKFLLVDNEEEIKEIRNGGVGSTSRKGE